MLIKRWLLEQYILRNYFSSWFIKKLSKSHIEWNFHFLMKELKNHGQLIAFCCCPKTAVCIGDQLLDISVPVLVWSQSTFSIYLEVLHNCTGFTLCSLAVIEVSECSAVTCLTPCILCVQIYCVLCVLDYYLLNSQLWTQDWVGVGLCFGSICICWVLLRVWLPQTISLHRLLKFSTQIKEMASCSTHKIDQQETDG